MDNTVAQLKDILKKNKNFSAREGWEVLYQKDSDMIVAGGEYPAGSFYHYVGDTDVMLRLDNKGVIHGFAIENAKYFLKESPNFKVVLSPFVHPLKNALLHPFRARNSRAVVSIIVEYVEHLAKREMLAPHELLSTSSLSAFVENPSLVLSPAFS